MVLTSIGVIYGHKNRRFQEKDKAQAQEGPEAEGQDKPEEIFPGILSRRRSLPEGRACIPEGYVLSKAVPREDRNGYREEGPVLHPVNQGPEPDENADSPSGPS